MKKLAIWGWWQGKNLGDNWIRHVLEDQFPGAFFIPTTEKDFRPYGFVLCGGGGLFVRNMYAPWLPPVTTPYGMIGIGAEFPHADGLAARICEDACFFYARDMYTLRCMNIFGRTPSYDVTFLAPAASVAERDVAQATLIWREPGVLLQSDDFCSYIGPYAPKEDWKKNISCYFPDIVEDDFQYQVDWNPSGKIGNPFVIISGRFHGVIAAIQMGIPCIGIDICPKIRAIMRDAKLEKYCLKIGDVAKLPEILRDLSINYEKIISLERVYAENAMNNMRIIYREVKKIIDEVLYG